ncbi:MAG: hypothetical protein MOGMAGMI_01989 [Candidatus Omnitrophica bacterium]|nr:hypothetical protein [Candidatus Omnitrophota bacterium]
MPKMFGTRYAEVKGSCVLDELLKEKIVVAAPIASEYGTDKYAVAAKHVNQSRVVRIAKALSTKK